MERTLRYCQNVIVVDDGSDDGSADTLKGLDITLLRHERNRGKGRALKTGFAEAWRRGYKAAITLDADLQHFPEDIPAFIKAHEKSPGAMIVGCRDLKAEGMPGGNTFANKFSNFWFKVQTGLNLPDTQSGFRMYPLERLGRLWWLTSRYEAELEILVSQCWKGVKIIPVPIRISYAPEGERVTHFRPARDFARISLLNVILCILAIIYGLPRRSLTAFWRRVHGE